MSRSRPLQELPLKLFLSGIPDIGSFDTNTNNKRPLSPSSQSFQYAKRRILDNSAGSSRSPNVVKTSRFAEPIDYTSVLHGPDSPARVLDFSRANQPLRLPEDDDPDRTPRSKHVQDSHLTPSSKLQATLKASTSLAQRFPHPIHPLVFDIVPRDLPPPTDPESEHYPGFVVYRDPHTVIARCDETRTLDPPLADLAEDPEKENTVPPREIRKLTSMFADVHTKSTTPGKGKQRLGTDSSIPFSLNHRKIFGNGFEDDMADMSTSYGVSRRSRLASELLDDSESAYGSPLFQAHSDGDRLVG